MEIFYKLLLGLCLLFSIQYSCIDAVGSENRDIELAEHEFEIIIHDEQFMHYFINMGLKFSLDQDKMRQKIKKIFARGVPHEFFTSEFPQKKDQLEAILYHPEFGITKLSDTDLDAKFLRNKNIFNEQLNDKAIRIYESTHKEIKKKKLRESRYPTITNCVCAPTKEFEFILNHSKLYEKIRDAVCSYLDKEMTGLPFFFVKIKINTRDKIFTVQAAPNHAQSEFSRTYDSLKVHKWVEDRSFLTNYCLEFLL